MPFRRKRAFRRVKKSSFTRMKANSDYKQYLKDKGILKCEACGWHDPLIHPYYLIETHHIRRVADGGQHLFANQLALCPNHHRLADRISKANAKLKIDKRTMIALILEHSYNSRIGMT